MALETSGQETRSGRQRTRGRWLSRRQMDLVGARGTRCKCCCNTTCCPHTDARPQKRMISSVTVPPPRIATRRTRFASALPSLPFPSLPLALLYSELSWRGWSCSLSTATSLSSLARRFHGASNSVVVVPGCRPASEACSIIIRPRRRRREVPQSWCHRFDGTRRACSACTVGQRHERDGRFCRVAPTCFGIHVETSELASAVAGRSGRP